MDLPTESGLKIVARILARENPSIFEALFADPVGSKFGPDIADFAFYKNAFSLKQNVLFDTILVHIFPSYVDGKKTGGLEGKCIFIDTDSSFPLLAFVSFIENFLSTRYPSTPHSNMVDEILSRLYVVNARTTVECILALLTLRDIIKFDRKYLLVVGSISARFGLFPKKEIAIAELLFFDFLKYIVDTFHIQCICIRMLPSTKDVRHSTVPLYYRPTQRVVFRGTDSQSQPVKVEITEGDRPAFISIFKNFSRVGHIRMLNISTTLIYVVRQTSQVFCAEILQY
uniref:Dna repair protein xrcc2 n=1 Tax=Echinococcus granulosus TaxID=6210 RepID=A0A068WDR9_ECHGR|nr:dna repair protein xrcc2 [Echinococcus granulosus]